MRILLLGRTKRNVTGGLARSAQLIKRALEWVGHEVEIRNVQAPLGAIPPGTELLWHYGDTDHLRQQLGEAEKAEVPALVNSSWDGSHSSLKRCSALMEIMRHDLWKDPMPPAPHVGLVTFTHDAARDLCALLGGRVQVVAIPKTIRSRPPKRPMPFERRLGVCIGDLEKLNRARLLGMAPPLAVMALKNAGFPKVFAYNQYGTAETPAIEGVEVVSKMEGADFIRWLGTLRLFVSLAAHETFAMVPCEAQSQGTPVLFYPQPQSHNEYFGFTAAAYSGPWELERLARLLNENETIWSGMSRSGIYNAHARAADLGFLGSQLTMAIERFLATKGT